MPPTHLTLDIRRCPSSHFNRSNRVIPKLDTYSQSSDLPRHFDCTRSLRLDTIKGLSKWVHIDQSACAEEESRVSLGKTSHRSREGLPGE